MQEQGMRGRRRGLGMMGDWCSCCGQMMGMTAAQADGPHRGKGAAQRSDAQITAKVKDALTEDAWLDAFSSAVSVQNGVVTLTGTVASRAAKR